MTKEEGTGSVAAKNENIVLQTYLQLVPFGTRSAFKHWVEQVKKATQPQTKEKFDELHKEFMNVKA